MTVAAPAPVTAVPETPAAARSLRSNTVWNLAGVGCYAVSQWAVISVLARTGGSVAAGKFSLALSVTAPLFMFSNLQLRAVQATDGLQQHSFTDYFSLRLVTATAALAVALAIAAVVPGAAAVWPVVAALAIAKAVEAVSDIHQGAFQQRERLDLVATSLLLKAALCLAAFTVTYRLTSSLPLACLALAAGQMTTLAGFDAPRVRKLGLAGRKWLRYRPEHLRPMLAGSLPLGLTMMLISLQTALPRFEIERSLGTHALGIFAGIAYLPTAGSLVISAMAGAAVPRLATLARSGQRREFRLLLAKMAAAGLLLGVVAFAGCAWGGPRILRLLYGAEYASYTPLLLWLMVAGAVSYVVAVYGSAATALGCFSSQPVVLAGTTAALLLSCVYLVPRFGLHGAAWAMLLSYTLCLAAYAVIVHRHD